MSDVEVPLDRLSFDPRIASTLTADAIERGAMQRLVGAAPSELRRLAPAHRACIALHCSGSSSQAIATRLNRPYAWVIMTLADPLSKQVIDRLMSQVEREIEALMPLAVHAIREQLLNGSANFKMRAAEMVMKANHRYVEQGEDRRTAEDVIQNILAFASQALHAMEGKAPSEARSLLRDPVGDGAAVQSLNASPSFREPPL